MALAEMSYPGDCRPNPENREPYHRLAGENRAQDEGNGDKRERDCNRQGQWAPSKACEIEEPEDHRKTPIKRGVPKGVANWQQSEVAMSEGEIV